MTEKMAEAFSKHGIVTGLDDIAVIGRVVKRYGCSADMVTLQERHLTQAFQEVFFEKVFADQRIQKMTDLFGAIPQSAPYEAVGIQNEIRSHLMKAGKVCFVPLNWAVFPVIRFWPMGPSSGANMRGRWINSLKHSGLMIMRWQSLSQSAIALKY
ncbi:MAG: hypothetical protein ACYSOU_02945 [Planctomycetota bacterium]